MYHISKYQYNNLEKQFLCQLEMAEGGTQSLSLSLQLLLTTLIQYRDVKRMKVSCLARLLTPTFSI